MSDRSPKTIRSWIAEAYYRPYSRADTFAIGSFAVSIALVGVLHNVQLPSDDIAQRHANAAAASRTTSSVDAAVCDQLPYLTIAYMAKNDQGQSEPVYMNTSSCKVPVKNSALSSTRSTVGYIDPRDQFSISCVIAPEHTDEAGRQEEARARVSVYGTSALNGTIGLSQEAVINIGADHLIEACPRTS